jgi:hypothetical protein
LREGIGAEIEPLQVHERADLLRHDDETSNLLAFSGRGE